MRHPIKIKLPKEVSLICELLHSLGLEAYPVGGCVRDVALHLRPKDWDIATSADLETCLLELSKLSGCIDVKQTGENFPVCRIRFETGNEYEIATFRKDAGIGKETTFSYATIEEDVKRRDLTINSLFYDIQTSEIVDLVGGYDDLNNRTIRFVGEPSKRITEDASRVQRAIRMAIRFNFTIEDNSKNALRVLGKNIVSEEIWGKNRVAFERVFTEFTKAEEHDISQYFSMLNEYDILDQFFPNLLLEKTMYKFTDLRMVIASLLKFENQNKIKKVLVDTCRWPHHIVRDINFLIEILSFKGFNIAKFVKSYEHTQLTTEDITIFSRTLLDAETSRIVTLATTYKQIISGDILLQLGYSGKDLGIKQVELEDKSFQVFCQN